MILTDPDAEQARLARARASRVMFCTPVYRDLSWQYTRSLVDACVMLERLGVHHRAQFVIGNSNLPRARNELVAEFLATDCTDMIFVDSDMGWGPEAAVRLLGSAQPLIGAAGRKRADKPNSDPSVWCVRLLGDQVHQDETGAMEVAGVGTGFLKISRAVFERLIEAHPDWKLRGFESMPDQVRAQYHRFFRFGEDFGFCDAWRRMGGAVWVDPDIRLSHAGAHDYAGTFSEMLVAEDGQ